MPLNPSNAAERYDAPPFRAAAVTPDDDTDLDPYPTRCLWVGVSGSVHVTLAGGHEVTFQSVAAGMWHPMMVRRVHATGTTATGIIVGW